MCCSGWGEREGVRGTLQGPGRGESRTRGPAIAEAASVDGSERAAQRESPVSKPQSRVVDTFDPCVACEIPLVKRPAVHNSSDRADRERDAARSPELSAASPTGTEQTKRAENRGWRENG